ncbi:MAG: transketolase C-terminal domain-containing protein, partial [Bacteroidaceae bacterium]
MRRILKMSKNACRKAFGDELVKLAASDENIIVICSDSKGSCSMTEFSETYPKQFVEVGIAEQNEVGIAAGMSTAGYKPFVCAPACFLSARSLEQVKVDVAYSHKNVALFGVSGGVSYGALGQTHFSTHDIAVMRCMPDLSVVLPSDARQTAAVAKYFVNNPMPVYIRVGRAAVEDIYGENDDSFIYGKANELREGTDAAIIACGEMVKTSLDAADLLAEEGIKIRVLDFATIKPIDRDAIIKAAKETGAILSIEEHSVNNGLGSIVASIVGEEYPVPLKIMGLPDINLITGESDEIKDEYHLDCEGVIANMRELLKRKNN